MPPRKTVKRAAKKTATKKIASKKTASKKIITPTPVTVTAKQFIERLKTYQSPAELKKYERYFRFSESAPLKNDVFIGVRMGQVFALAKEFIGMPLAELEKLLESKIHEARAGALSIMEKQARSKNPVNTLEELYNLYIRRHDRINNWDLVDLAAYHVVGRYLEDKTRDILYTLAKSANTWERRTAIVSTAHFIRKGDLADAFQISEVLMQEPEDLVHKGMGWMLRFAGSKDQKQLLAFLDKHAAHMPRVALRYSIEHLSKKQRDHYLSMKDK
ncbi:MAG TPA: DNA alkylation repair protein [Ohtaekwangia sp.]|uniref:DNA alkylation repair protein n=1 Tax=Ohtaekwangia sp. TaxID=2066019 RepID=UPI002F920321